MGEGPHDIEARLVLTEHRLQLLSIEGEYCRRYDSQDAERWAALFVEDGVYQGRQLEGMGPQNLVRGRSALEAFCASQKLSGMHSMAVPHIVVDGDRASGRTHFRFEAGGSDERGRVHARVAVGYYDIAYVLTAEGWRIRRRVTTYLSLEQKTTYGYEPTDFDLDSPISDVAFDAR